MEKIVEHVYHGHNNFIITREVVEASEPSKALLCTMKRKYIAKVEKELTWWKNRRDGILKEALEVENDRDAERLLEYIDHVVKPNITRLTKELTALTAKKK